MPSPEPLFSARRAEDSIESLLAERSSRGRGVYLLLLALVLAAGALLPVIRVPVWVRSNGIIRPALEKHEVRAGASGVTLSVPVRENEAVYPGSVLATLRPRTLEARRELLQQQIADVGDAVHDLEAMLAADSPLALPPHRLRTARHRLEVVHLRSAAEEQRQRVDQAARELQRARELQARQLISRAELERHEDQWEREALAASLQQQRTLREWEASLASHRASLRGLAAERAEIDERRELLTVVAPVAGTVEQLASISPGSLVQTGERIAVISPSAELVAEVYVTPRQIGLLAPGTPVRMRVDAFRSSDWGLLPGRVAEIPGDVVRIGQAPVYRVRVALGARSLVLPSGARGELRKGMTLEARFVLAERSLWQLLRDDVADWFGAAPRGERPA